MRRWLVALVLAWGLTAEAQPLTGGLLGRPQSAGTTYNPVTDTVTGTGTIVAKNLTATGLATPGSITVTPVLSRVATITTVAGSALADGDHFLVEYGPGLTVPVEFDATPGDGTTGGRVPLVFAPGDSADDIRDAIIVLLNGAAPAALTASSGGAATVALVLDTPGAGGGPLSETVTDAGFLVAGFADPTAATTYTYRLVWRLPSGATTEGGAASSTAAGYGTLSVANRNDLSWTAGPAGTVTDVYRTVGGATQGKIATGTTATTLSDTGLAGGGETAPTADGTGVLHGDGLRIGTSATPGHVLTADALGNYTPQASGGGVPSGCVATSVPVFLGSPVAMGCDAGLTYDAATKVLATGIGGSIGTYGANPGDGAGLMGIGAAAQKGFGLWLDGGTVAITAGEVLGAQFMVASNPAAAANAGVFGSVSLGKWGGAADSRPNGYVYGAQTFAQVSGTASLLSAKGNEGLVQSLATGGTITQAYGVHASVDNQSTGTITEANGLFANVGNGGGGTVTDASGVKIGSVVGTNAIGLNVGSITGGTTTNYAIKTAVGAVSFGDTVSAPSATIPILYGVVSVGDTTTPVGLKVNGKTAQAPNLFDLQVNNVSKFLIDNNGSVSFTGGDVNFGGVTAIFGSGQGVRLADAGADMKSNGVLRWSSTTHAYDTTDFGIGRDAAGRGKATDGSTGYGAWVASQYRLSALNTAPATAASTGTLGEIRVTATAIYICTATDTWVKADLATW